MSGCTAKLKVDGQTVTCVDHDELSRYPHSAGPLAWGDEAPGATPTTEYRSSPFGTFGGWRVENERGHAAASFFGSEHPDPRGAAEAEAARLNGDDLVTSPPSGDYSRGFHDGCVETKLVYERERDEALMKYGEVGQLCDDVTAERDAARAEAEDNRLAMVDAGLQRDQVRIERDRYFDALAVIYKGVSGKWARDVARTALYGGAV